NAHAVVDRPTAGRQANRLALLTLSETLERGRLNGLEPGGAGDRDDEERRQQRREQADAAVEEPLGHDLSAPGPEASGRFARPRRRARAGCAPAPRPVPLPQPSKARREGPRSPRGSSRSAFRFALAVPGAAAPPR